MARRKSLVCQYIENVSREVLERHQEIVRQFIKGRPGIYALFRKGKLYYVGLARNLRGRLAQHLRGRHGASWDRFSIYLTIGDAHMKELESLTLRIVRPAGNTQKGKFARAENLQRALRRNITASARQQILSYFGEDTRPPEPPRRRRGADDGRHPILAKYIHHSLHLRRRYKGHLCKAQVRSDGSIRFAGKVFTSPSEAGSAAMGGQACNGWLFWQYERAPGDWVLLDMVRR
jgi:predicted GIY-YIG superfamily endonuclease